MLAVSSWLTLVLLAYPAAVSVIHACSRLGSSELMIKFQLVHSAFLAVIQALLSKLISFRMLLSSTLTFALI
jgi:hypothetical protein